MGGEPEHHGILAVDIEGFGRLERGNPARVQMRAGLYRALDDALAQDVTRAVLAQVPADLVLVVSDAIYQGIVKHGYDAIESASFYPVWVSAKETTARAWIQVPGSPAADLPRFLVVAPDRSPMVSPLMPPSLLPPDISDFVGRQDALRQIRGLIEGGQDRSGTAVTISSIAGKAGVGKTALAVRVAHQLMPHFPDGQLYVNLRGAEARPVPPDTVLERFLRVLGVDRSAIPEDLEQRVMLYRARLAGKRVLVLLDNAASAAQVRPLLPGAASCAVLVTSRIRLPELEGAHPVLLDVLDQPQAVELLGNIAGPARVLAETGPADEIVTLCGRLPLAVRIAGARLALKAHWRLSRLADRLRDERQRLNELRTGDLEVRASFALSYDGQPAPERRAFRLLGVLDLPEFAAWVAAALLDRPVEQAADLLERLVDAQLLEPAGEDPSGEIRYRFHDLLRVFARERLRDEEPPESRQAALNRALRAYLVLTERAGMMLGHANADAAGGLPGGSRWWNVEDASHLADDGNDHLIGR